MSERNGASVMDSRQQAAEAFARAESLRRRGDHEGAERAVLESLGLEPYNADGHCLLARIHAARGDAVRARDEWMMALRLSPGHPGATAALESRTQRPTVPRVSVMPTAHQQAPAAAELVPQTARRSTEHVPPATPRTPSANASGTAAGGIPSFADPRVVAALLADRGGLVVAQHAVNGVGEPTCAALGALFSNLTADTAGALDALRLGAWRTLSVECTNGGLELASAPDGHLVIVAVRSGTPLGLARRYLSAASRQARALLEHE